MKPPWSTWNPMDLKCNVCTLAVLKARIGLIEFLTLLVDKLGLRPTFDLTGEVTMGLKKLTSDKVPFRRRRAIYCQWNTIPPLAMCMLSLGLHLHSIDIKSDFSISVLVIHITINYPIFSIAFGDITCYTICARIWISHAVSMFVLYIRFKTPA